MRKAWIAGAVAVVLIAGYAVADAQDVVPGFLTLAATGSGGGVPGPAYPHLSSPVPVLAAASTSAPVPDAAVLARLIGPSLSNRAVGPKTSGVVYDVATGRAVYSKGGTTPRTPASTTKLTTALSLLRTVGPSATFATTVVQASATHIVLVGGGDAQLSAGSGTATASFGRAGLGTLAALTATALKAKGTRTVNVALDDSLFSGPTENSHWAPTDAPQGQVGPVTPIALFNRQAQIGHPAPADPAMVAAKAFVVALVHDGIAVKGALARTRAPAGVAPLAEVRSAPVETLLTTTLALSDNTEAEVLARLAARASGRPGSFVGAVATIRAQLAAVGVPLTGMRTYDASGLARADRIPPRVLSGLLVAAATSPDPALRELFPALPVAGYTGTLGPRFHHGRSTSGLGVVRAKTGTLMGVVSLAGSVVDASGRLLVFAFMASDVPVGGDTAARSAIDRAAALVASCGCAAGSG